MPRDKSDKRLKQVRSLLLHKLIKVYTNEAEASVSMATLFFGEIPEELLLRRGEAIARDERFREWILITDETMGSEYLEALRGEYAIDVIHVDDLCAAHFVLLQSTTQPEDNLHTKLSPKTAITHDAWQEFETMPLTEFSLELQTDETSIEGERLRLVA